MTEKSIFDFYHPDSPIGTEFLRIYHNVVKQVGAKSTKSFLVTSAILGEGKSTVASFLALTLGALSKKTLLVDADLRRPALHRFFNLYLEEGISDVADGSIPLAKALKETKLASLKVLTAGRLSREPGDYFEEGHVRRILTEVETAYEFVIVDCAPVLPVVDALVMAQSMSGVLLVIKAGATHRELVKQATEILQKAGSPLLGVLLNNAKQVLPHYHEHRYAYEYYRPSADATP